MGDFKDLAVYKKAFKLSMDIFDMTKKFPKDEVYALTSQIRRSSRAVCANLGEAYRKRRYVSHFLLKISDADMENTETQIWLNYSVACKYITEMIYKELTNENEQIGKLINDMLKEPFKYGCSEKETGRAN